MMLICENRVTGWPLPRRHTGSVRLFEKQSPKKKMKTKRWEKYFSGRRGGGLADSALAGAGILDHSSMWLTLLNISHLFALGVVLGLAYLAYAQALPSLPPHLFFPSVFHLASRLHCA